MNDLRTYQNISIRQQEDREDYPDRRYYRAIISSPRKDSQYSIMDDTSLENFANDAANGVNVLDNHNQRTIGLGRTVSGEFDRESKKVYSDFYLLTDLELDGQSFTNSNLYIKALDDGMANDVSVGFYGANRLCNICGKSMWTYGAEPCNHWPGSKYEIEGEDGIRRITECLEVIADARLAELSLVYDGANEDAVIIKKMVEEKAQRTARSLTPEQRDQISTRFHVDFDQYLDQRKKERKNNQVDEEEKVKMSTDKLSKDERIAELEALNEKLTQRCKDAEDKVTNSVSLKTSNEELSKRLKESQEDAVTSQKNYDSQRERLEKLEEYKSNTEPIVERYNEIKEEEVKKALDLRLGAFPDEGEEHEDYLNDLDVLRSMKSIKQIRKHAKLWENLTKENYPGGKQIPDEDKKDAKDKKDEGNEENVIKIAADANAY